MTAGDVLQPPGTRTAGDAEPSLPSLPQTNITSKNSCGPTQETEEEKEDVTLIPSHKRTFSNGPDQHVSEDPLTLPVQPPNKKAKSDTRTETLVSSESDSNNGLKTSSDDHEGKDLVPLTPHGPNTLYGYTDTLSTFFDAGEDHGDGYWLKSMITDVYSGLVEKGDIPCVAISCDPECLETPEAKLLQNHFEALDGDSWFEVALTRQLPAGAPKVLQVEVESGWCDAQSGVFGGKHLGKWWMIDITVAEGESEKAVATVISEMF